ncbi:MAG TPA: glycosyltransferase family 2 protein [Sedimentisphaerales bacterium]|nr:glycosyltransferase family 2 protein [Sedimentisphaerales bacterium]HRS12095.1 glycosyltransferase family 2 protein [Sedimentisphaerales bacterium]HRV48693.1 glycosyltransferase family 2 protein [Sedimentisphaerales bacterium]
MTHNKGQMELSVVVPLLDEQENLRPLYDQIRQALDGRYVYEIIFVDDGSTDGSFQVLKEFHDADPNVRVIRFRKNFGQTAALSAGFSHARGGVVIAMDADLQNDPADIPMLVAKLDEGYDVVSGWRKERHDKVLTRRLPSRTANWLISKITGVKLHDYGCTLKAYRREVLAQTKLYGEMHRFIPALASWSGAQIAECVVNHRPRTAGVAKYGLGRTWKVILDLITVKFLGSFSTKPIYIFGGLGGLMALFAFLLGLMVISQKVNSGVDMSGNPLLLLTAVLFLTTIQFILMGLLAELLVRTYHESQNRPTYVIREVLDATDCCGDHGNE